MKAQDIGFVHIHCFFLVLYMLVITNQGRRAIFLFGTDCFAKCFVAKDRFTLFSGQVMTFFIWHNKHMTKEKGKLDFSQCTSFCASKDIMRENIWNRIIFCGAIIWSLYITLCTLVIVHWKQAMLVLGINLFGLS